jgi:hypothetical protein
MEKPNLFSFATSELSQDAFICWLSSWAEPIYEKGPDVPLHDAATNFLKALLELCEMSLPDVIEKIEIKRQAERIDVAVIINEKTAILIEDKTGTMQHGDQLATYRNKYVREYGEDNVAPIYLKTGDQCDYSDVDHAEFACFRRQDFIAILKAGRERGVSNQIYTDFLDHLERWEESVNAYATMKLQDWDTLQWIGFYKEIQKKVDGWEWWGYVPNQTGGFMGFSWHRKDNRYLQLEQKRLCFKIRVKDADRSTRRDEWASALQHAKARGGLSIQKPDRFGHGETMTVAVYKDDYRLSNSSGVLDMVGTLKLLKQAEELADAASVK